MERKGQITIKDIAKELGISPSTVSRSLKNHPDISEKTKLAVNTLAKKYNYKPNAVALSLRSSKTNIIGVVIPQVVHFFFSSVISGIEHVANDAGYNVMICQSNEKEEREKNIIQALTSSRVDGILACIAKTTTNLTHFKELLKDKTPLVCFDRTLDEIPTDKVIIDDIEGAFMATEHLIKKGCKRIIHLGAPQNLLIGKRRQEGYIKALHKHNIPIDHNLIYKCDSREDALIIMQEIFNKGIMIDGVFAANDLTATGALKTAKNNGFKVPEDIKIIGFSNGFVANVTDPTLSTINQHGFEMGKIAAELLLGRINKTINNYSPVTKIIKTELICRESTGFNQKDTNY